jgi:hypothetical protein
MSDSGIYTIVTKATMLIRNDPMCGPRLMNSWLPADTWVGELQKTGHIDAALAIDTHNFNAAFAKSGSFGSLMSRFDGSNHTGVFHVRYQHQQYYYSIFREDNFIGQTFADFDIDLSFSNLPTSICQRMAKKLGILDDEKSKIGGTVQDSRCTAGAQQALIIAKK